MRSPVIMNRKFGCGCTVTHTAAATIAAIGMIQRRGLGKVWHVDVQHLWIQEAVREGRKERHDGDLAQHGERGEDALRGSLVRST